MASNKKAMIAKHGSVEAYKAHMRAIAKKAGEKTAGKNNVLKNNSDRARALANKRWAK